MKSFRRQMGLIALLLTTLASGCELGRKTFYMDSNSPNPFFGIDLIPRRATSSWKPPREGVNVELVGGEEFEPVRAKVR
jgi:hypothetical protein